MGGTSCSRHINRQQKQERLWEPCWCWGTRPRPLFLWSRNNGQTTSFASKNLFVWQNHRMQNSEQGRPTAPYGKGGTMHLPFWGRIVGKLRQNVNLQCESVLLFLDAFHQLSFTWRLDFNAVNIIHFQCKWRAYDWQAPAVTVWLRDNHIHDKSQNKKWPWK